MGEIVGSTKNTAGVTRRNVLVMAGGAACMSTVSVASPPQDRMKDLVNRLRSDKDVAVMVFDDRQEIAEELESIFKGRL